MTREQAATAEPVPPPSQEEVEEVLDRLAPVSTGDGGAGESNLIGLLQDVQDHFGYLPAPALDSLSRRTRIPLSRIYGVVSFYAQFYTEPRGKHTILCCRGTACHVKGTARVLDMIRQTLGIEEGQTTPDMKFYLETVACLGTCFLAPVMMIDDQYYGTLTPQRVESILTTFDTGGA
jgi:NADH-quinone oxidoreductase subunit E